MQTSLGSTKTRSWRLSMARAVVLVVLGTMAGITVWAFQHEIAGERCRSVIVGDAQYITCTRTRPAPEARR